MNEILTVTKVSKTYKVKKQYKSFREWIKNIFSKDCQFVKAVKDVSFKINKGEIVGFVGPNGAGKSTTIKMMTGILTADSGEIRLNGKSPYKDRKKYVKSIGCVFGQRSQLWWDLPVMDSYLLLKNIYGISNEDFNRYIHQFTSLIDIEKYFEKPVRLLSLGERMKCEILAAFLHNPEMVFLDEPTIGLDVVAKEDIRNIIRFLNKQYNTTIILTTHDMSDIEELCERIIIIDKGSVVYDGKLDDIKRTFSSKRQISIKFEKDTECSFEDVKIIKDEGNRKTIELDINDLPVATFLTKLSVIEGIIDVEIRGIEIESIIRELYKNSFKYEEVR